MQFEVPLVGAQDFQKPCAVGAGDADQDPAFKGGWWGSAALTGLEQGWRMVHL